jgi:mono/diheme cytochrome c family protein
MRFTLASVMVMALLLACAAEKPYDPRFDYEELAHTGMVPSPPPRGGQFAPVERDTVERGRYLVELLGCGACHTDGAFEGAPDMDRLLAGSQTGIAYTNPLEYAQPGIVYPANITPDEDTGIGRWSDVEIANAIRAGIGRHARGRIATMPWPGYAKLAQDDVDAIVAYLRSIPAVRHAVPGEVLPGHEARKPFVYFGVYRSRD